MAMRNGGWAPIKGKRWLFWPFLLPKSLRNKLWHSSENEQHKADCTLSKTRFVAGFGNVCCGTPSLLKEKYDLPQFFCEMPVHFLICSRVLLQNSYVAVDRRGMQPTFSRFVAFLVELRAAPRNLRQQIVKIEAKNFWFEFLQFVEKFCVLRGLHIAQAPMRALLWLRRVSEFS